MKRFILLFILPLTFAKPLFILAAPLQAPCPNTGRPPVFFTLDAVPLSLCTTFLQDPHFVVSAPGNAIQIAYASQTGAEQREFLITTVQYGKRFSTEELAPADENTGEEVYRAQLRAARVDQGGHPQPGSALRLFGRAIPGDTSTVPLFLDGIHAQSTRITEWVIKAGNRLWVIRASQPDNNTSLSTSSITQGDAALAATTLDSQNLAGASIPLGPTTGSLYGGSGSITSASPSPTATPEPNLPTPPWWSGQCNLNQYITSVDNPSKLPSYPLGATYRALVACGPRPFADHAPDVLVRFYTGAWGEFEWECVELSMRFLYLAYGIPPYSANGNTVVPNYAGDKMIKFPNGAPGVAPQPDDVLSYCATCTFGHTSVVTASSVDSQGNGGIMVIEENNSPTGTSILPVSSWVVAGNSGPVTGWLRAGTYGYHIDLPVILK